MAEGPTAYVLWVESGERDLSELEARLRPARFKLARAATLADALEILTSLPIEVVVLDLEVRDGGGLSAIPLIREHAPRVPLVALASTDADYALSEILRAGAEEVLGRHALPAVVLRTLRHAIDRARWGAQTRQLLRVHPDPAIVVDRQQNVLFANGPAERLFGPDLRRAPFEVAQGIRRTVLPPELGRAPAEVRAVELSWGTTPALAATVRLLNEQPEDASVDARLVHISRLASVGALVTGVTHEANNLAMSFLADLAYVRHQLQGLPAARRRELESLLEETGQTAKRMASMLADVCAFARANERNLDWVDINGVVNTACRWVHDKLNRRGRLITSLSSVPPIVGDEMELRQVLVNLLMNAVDAIEARGGSENRIVVETRAEGGKLIVTVEDTGTGVPEELQRRIFEPFFTTKPLGSGTGLGLSLSGEIVKRHGGEIEVERTSTGSIFRIVLPEQNDLRL